MKRLSLVFIVSTMLFTACKKNPISPVEGDADLRACALIVGADCLEPHTQRKGDPAAGYDYLVGGDYIRSGIPYDLYLSYYGADNSNYLSRTGDNASINYQYTAVDAPNGARVVAPNCLQCHAQTLNGEFVMGLGNSTYDFTIDQGANATTLEAGILLLYGASSPQYEASQKFLTAIKAVGPHLMTEVRGVNPADKLATVLAAHRDPDDLSWNAVPSMEIPTEVIPSDVPAWWLLKKKYAMFYTAVGRQDFVRFMMASSLLTVDNHLEAEEIEEDFIDVLAYVETIEAPVYPESIDMNMASKGEVVFENNCAVCHGTYGENETYPNVLIPTSFVGTDPLLAQSNYDQDYFLNWFNNSWFGREPNAGILQASASYIAPPLDGVWATAPYLHNGSVPTLEDLLNSKQRPTYWQRSFNTSDFDFEKIGWNYSETAAGGSTDIYNTTLPGYSNAGHTFADELTDEDRKALLEYLKTL